MDKIYYQQKTDFLDSLQPDDFRNPSSFNQVETIVDNINQAYYRSIISKPNSEDFIYKAFTNLFRDNSSAIDAAINLSRAYIKFSATSKG